jgi:hypothetical protein
MDSSAPVGVAQPVQRALTTRRIGHAEADRRYLHAVPEVHPRRLMTVGPVRWGAGRERPQTQEGQERDDRRSAAFRQSQRAQSSPPTSPIGGFGHEPCARRHESPPWVRGRYVRRSPLSYGVVRFCRSERGTKHRATHLASVANWSARSEKSPGPAPTSRQSRHRAPRSERDVGRTRVLTRRGRPRASCSARPSRS